MQILFIIPARGGSKGLPGKNIKPLNGIPLLTHSVQHALHSKFDKKVVVSTDDSAIAEVAIASGAEVIERPIDISGDTASSESALIHALTSVENSGYIPDLIVFLQCTSPIREPDDIDNAIDLIIKEQSDSLLSASPNHRFIWKKGPEGFYSVNYDYNKRQRRQDLEPEFVENGSIYIFKPWVLKKNNNRLGGKVSLYLMSDESSYEIDSAMDFMIIENLMKGLE